MAPCPAGVQFSGLHTKTPRPREQWETWMERLAHHTSVIERKINQCSQQKLKHNKRRLATLVVDLINVYLCAFGV